MKYILITGVSTGIGYAATAEFLSRGYHIFGSVRKQEDANRLQEDFGPNFTPLLFDVTDHQAIAQTVPQVAEILGDSGLTALINNAGVLIPGPLMRMPLEDFRLGFEINLISLLDVTQQFLPLLGARPDAPFPPGRIVNMGSVSGKFAYPLLGGYAATKHGLEAFSDALRRELMIYGVDVILIESGTTRTPILDKIKVHMQQYQKTEYAPMVDKWLDHMAERDDKGMPMERVIDTLCKAVERERPKTRYAIPRKWLSGWIIPRFLPDRWLDRIAANRLGY